VLIAAVGAHGRGGVTDAEIEFELLLVAEVDPECEPVPLTELVPETLPVTLFDIVFVPVIEFELVIVGVTCPFPC